MAKQRKTKPLFTPIKMEQGDYIQERKKKVAKLQLQQAVNNLETDLVCNVEFEQIQDPMNKFRRQIRKILKNL